jgi:trehalose 6-phosphate phosphatase
MHKTNEGILPLPPDTLLRNASLFIDLDGTLIELASRPDAVIVDERLREVLSFLRSVLRNRVVIVSGRPAAELQRLLRLPKLAVAGSHGREIHLPDGRHCLPASISPPQHVVSRLRLLAATHLGVIIEEKPFGLALHFRLAPEAMDACQRAAEEIASSEGYVLQPGKKVFELKFHSATKGDAVSQLMTEQPLCAGTPLFIGDDLTDEAGFEAATRLGGAGVLVGAPRKTHAQYRLDSVVAALDWLETSARSMA